ncbi:SDR family NAD(P)-dependent oxidoreductase [Gordonia alkanivorans]|uniref:SDR family NAD(P)-dependent oxidoreductase n=1 Tax=Gordonia alkanivorans TaxID=84096 RepID=UPI00244906AA|nr:SDR family NAD(P)-dependent oxidoreductase [Gordonia alkanivorans]MDH3022790.1 SDR family NAD(P)-dependent oxidoreductase [Gordonia alkanivorans]MDH3047556.1 SDR family NAD(P)-dependent oxidoreductase [Gordonia alkanivorans]
MIDKNHYGPWAVIAGGSEGVGASFADELSAGGINLVLIARKAGPLEETAARARANGVEVRTLALDLLASDAFDRIRSATDDLEVGLLIFNAGANSYGHEFVTGDLAGFQGVIDLNITSQITLTHHFGAKMKERGRGGIMLLGSLSGYMGAEHQGIYAATKAFSRIFAESLWLELEPFGVHVVELVLGVTRTPAMIRAGLNFDIPGMNVAEPEDVAREGLEHLADGPVWVAGGNYEASQKRNGYPRDKLVKGAAEAMRKLTGR